MKKHLLLIITLLFAQLIVYSQTIPYKFGNVTFDELTMSGYPADTSANAIILNEFGEAFIENDSPEFLDLNYYGKIKIFNQKGQSEATITIPLYKSGGKEEEIIGVEAYTYNLVSGEIVKTKLPAKEVYREGLNEKHNVVKFTFPQVKDGSVLEYKYILRSPFYFYNFHEWTFQSDIPKLRSEYWAKIPGYFNYKVSLRGLLKLSSQSTTLLKDCFDPPGNLKSDCTFFKAAMDNIPAMKGEEYMTTLRNYLARIEFEIEEYLSPTTGGKERFSTTWKDVERQLLMDSKFGPLVDKNQKFYTQVIPAEIAAQTDSLEKAKLIYAFIKKSIAWNEKYGMLASNDPKNIIGKHSGNIADINLFLTGTLKAHGFNVYPVILSTRENGYPTTLYPILTDFNYIIANVIIGGKSYLLDATEKELDFGTIPFRCLNKEGRIVDYKKSNWINLVPKLFDTEQINVEMTVSSDGSIKGSFAGRKYDYAAIKERKKINSFSSMTDFQKSIQDKFTTGTIDSLKTENLDVLNEPLEVKFKFKLHEEDAADSKTIYLQPFIFDKLESNPLKQNIRTFPIDFGIKKRSITNLSITIPEGYEVESIVKNTNFVLADKSGFYKIGTEINGNKVNIQTILQLNETIYPSEAYPMLKELFSLIIKTQNEPIVLKKKTVNIATKK
ncbi:DUF3857 domain-containing protein [Solitalea canadensis]|nr:DUF3857 domain-containing protein [Solitalea canadensis]